MKGRLNMSRIMGDKKAPVFILIAAFLSAIYAVPSVAQLGFDIVRHRSGHVMARGVALSENGHAVFVEYDVEGNEVAEIGEAINDRLDATVMSAERYRQIVLRYNEIKSEGETSFARGATVMVRESYDSQRSSFTTRDGASLSSVPNLGDNTLSVFVRHKDQILIPEISPILYEAPIDLNDAQELSSNITSVLLSTEGQVLHTSEHNIGYRVDFFKDSEDDPILRASEHDRVFQGIPNVPVESVSGYVNGFGVTDENGAFSTTFLIAPCPGFYMDYTINNYATLRYRRFSPQGSSHGLFALQSTAYESCNGIGANLAASGNLVGLLTYMNLLALQATSSSYLYPTNFYVDSAVLSGQGFLANPDPLSEDLLSNDTPITVTSTGNTVFEYTAPDDSPVAQTNFDFDGDEEVDRSVLGDWQDIVNSETGDVEQRFVRSDNGTLQGVYFSSGDGNPDLSVSDDLSQPDLVRLADKQEDFRHQGLLETISVADLQETDLYVFRESNGTLITHRRGLRENELAQWRARQEGGVLEDSSEIYYQFLIRGPKSNSVTLSNDFSAFQSDAEMNPALHARASDHLRSQEPIKIIAVNRRSGYIGSVSTQYGDYDNNPGLISFPIDKLVMRPPNLKVLVERKMQIEAGLTQCNSTDCEEEYLIGYEGAATTDDTILTITTEWFDHDNAPLPEALGEYGYTGRLAKVTGNNTLTTDGGQLAQFAVKPGRHLQTIRLRGDYDTSEHFYLQINGESDTENPDFSTLGAAIDGPLKYRPKNFVPFLVPLEDQDATLRQYNAYRTLLRDDSIANDTLEDYGPVHRWFYRPEMQFSMYDLDVQNIFRQADEEGSEAIDIYPDDKPVIASSDDIITLAYDLIAQQFEALPYLGSGQELVFAFGEEEVAATLDENANVVFTNIEHFAALDPEDFLSIRLYSNNDPGNILWEYAFEYIWLEPLYAGMDAQDEVMYVSADDPVVPLEAVLVGYAERDEALKQPATFYWTQVGSGVLSNSIQNDEDQGIFDNTLTLPTTAGSTSTVSVRMQQTFGTEATLPPIVVLPGEPAQISVSQTGEVSINGHGEVEFIYTIKDQHGNLVSDGTGVSVNLEESLRLVSADDETTGGKVTVVVMGGALEGTATITLRAGEIELADSVEVQPLNVALANGLSSYTAGEIVAETVIVTDSSGAPVANAEVTLTATYAIIDTPNLTTNASGEASFNLTLPDAEGSGNLISSIGFQFNDLGSFTVEYDQSEARNLETNYAALIGDQVTSSYIEYERYDGETIQVAYDASTSVNVLGSENDNVSLTLGDIHDPNIPAMTATGDLYAGTLEDKAGHLTLEANNVTQTNDTAMGAGTSLRFIQGNKSLLSTDDVNRIDLEDNLGVNLEIKPDIGGGTLVDLLDGMFVVELNATGTITASITTDQDRYSVTSTTAATYGSWHKVSARYTNGQLELWLNNEQITQTASGNLTGSTSSDEALAIGDGYSGKMHRIKWFDWSAAPLLTFSNGQTSGSFTVDASGSLPVTVLSTGNLNANSSSVDIQRVAIVSDQVRQYISVLSTDAFTGIASHYADTLAEDAPDINEGGLAAYYQPGQSLINGLFPQAHAFSLVDFGWGAINFFIPIEDTKIIYEQINNLLFGDPGSFDPAEFVIAAINVFTVLPPAKPLKLFTKPAAKFIRAMKAVNPKFLGAMGGVFKQVLHRGRKLDFDLLIQVVPFVVIAAELYQDPEAVEGLKVMVQSITSPEDAISWIEYLALPSDGWEGEGLSIVDAFSDDEDDQASLPLNFLFSPAYAASQSNRGINFTVVKQLFKKVKSIGKIGDVEDLPKGLSSILKVLKNGSTQSIRKIVHKDYLLRVAVAAVARSTSNAFQVMLKGEKYTRLSLPATIAVISYLTWESTCGKLLDEGQTSDAEDLNCNGIGFSSKLRYVYYRKMAQAFSDATNKNLSEENGKQVVAEENSDGEGTVEAAKKIAGYDTSGHGALFHLHELAKYQLWTRLDIGTLKLSDSEVYRVIGFLKDADDKDEAIVDGLPADRIKRVRWVDILLVNDSEEEHWVELKSLKAATNSARLAGDSLKPWTIQNQSKNNPDKGSSYHRQATLDRVAANLGVAWQKKTNSSDVNYSNRVSVSGYTWIFQKFSRNGERSPSLGSVSSPTSIKGKLAKDANVGSSKTTTYALGPDPANSNFGLNGFDQIKSRLIDLGFDIAEDADDIFTGLD